MIYTTEHDDFLLEVLHWLPVKYQIKVNFFKIHEALNTEIWKRSLNLIILRKAKNFRT